jgi:NAD(P)-dependent dehydrogenase (short-subunit alcohol dehydrogenase family)
MAYENSSWVGCVAVVMGGTTDIGRSLALDLSASGADVAATVAFWPAG